jgi:hypothetical protein
MKMTRILLDQKFNEIIPALLPANVKVAQQTGSLVACCHRRRHLMAENMCARILPFCWAMKAVSGTTNGRSLSKLTEYI